MRPQCLLLLVALILPLAAATSTVQIGGWKPIEDVSDPEVLEAAEFAVSEYNTKQAKAQNKLVFETVLRGETQLVAGTNYKLFISAKNESSVANPTRVIGTAAANNYEVFVYDRAWEHHKELSSFVVKQRDKREQK
ncbi:cysteine proteinase inhibitor 1-like [Malus domestica]|uniref:cysteine proteinase inhibitor 1-like n=1 Tax=Malus domestica TaxID=3750 RepID=UPI0039765C99